MSQCIRGDRVCRTSSAHSLLDSVGIFIANGQGHQIHRAQSTRFFIGFGPCLACLWMSRPELQSVCTKYPFYNISGLRKCMIRDFTFRSSGICTVFSSLKIGRLAWISGILGVCGYQNCFRFSNLHIFLQIQGPEAVCQRLAIKSQKDMQGLCALCAWTTDCHIPAVQRSRGDLSGRSCRVYEGHEECLSHAWGRSHDRREGDFSSTWWWGGFAAECIYQCRCVKEKSLVLDWSVHVRSGGIWEEDHVWWLEAFAAECKPHDMHPNSVPHQWGIKREDLLIV